MKKWRLITSEKIFSSNWLGLERRTYEANGITRDDYYHVERPDYVMIIAHDAVGKIVVEQQYRRGADEILYELPAGTIEQGETPVSAAKRELTEETGYTDKARLIGALYAQAGFMSMRAHVVVVDIEGSGEHKKLDADEAIELHLFSLEEIQDMIQTKKMTEMSSISALHLYELNGSTG